MRRHICLVAVAVIVASGPGAARAQEARRSTWMQGTSLSIFGGGGRVGSTTGAAAGATIGWELTPYFTIEGSGVWLDRPQGPTGFGAALGPRVNIIGRGAVVPFLGAGVGLYRERAGVTDPALAAGGGVDVFVTRHLAIRPEVRLLLARGDAGTRAVTVAGVHLAYHFESHNVTPQRGTRERSLP